MTEDEALDKIAQLAVTRAYWDDRAAREAVAMAKLHAEGPRTFLKKLLERKCGLTFDEIRNLERDALAPPPTQTPAKPLPRLGAARAASETANPALIAPQEIVTQKALPKLDAPKPDEPRPSPGGQEILTPKRALPRLNAPRKKPGEPPPA